MRSGKGFKPPQEWFLQADYDLETAKAMFDAGRYIYTVFMCHLSIEKALKGLYAKRAKRNPPKTHDLIYLCENIDLRLPEKFQNFLDDLNELSVPTRYPDALKTLLKQYKKDNAEKIFLKTKELLLWLKKKL